MKPWLRLLYPAEFRRRYEDEISEMLRHSRQPRRDQLNVAVHACHLRWEQLMTNLPQHLANVALAAAMFCLGFAVNDLEGGITEIHRHWWSTAALLLVVLAAAVRATVGAMARRRS